jgi:hypothetical protein
VRYCRLFLLCAAVAPLALVARQGRAASHSDAPLIKQDPQANITDVYSFVGTNRAGVKVLNAIVHVRPFCEPGDGVTYDRFAPDALYSIHVANPTTGATVFRYDFRFSAVSGPAAFKNLDTILSYGRGTEIGAIQDVGDARQNFVQVYTVSRVRGSVSTPLSRGLRLLVPPANVGARATPFYNDADGVAISGATTYDGLDRYTRESIYDLPSGETVFAGSREDGFYSDIPGIFDLLNPRILGPDGQGQTGDGVDGFKGYNVLAYAVQVPVSQLQSVPGFPSVGVYASVSRPHVTLREPGHVAGTGPFVQVNRMGNPLFNEGLVAVRDKDRYNALQPTADRTQFAQYARGPELITLINTVFGTSFQTDNRTDLVGIFIPDVLRVDTSTEPVRLAGQPGFNRLSLFGDDVTASGKPSGWPNGRRLGDDVVDIALTAIASGPSFQNIFLLGDNINANDQVYNQVFPYSGTPWGGTRNSKDSGPNKDP